MTRFLGFQYALRSAVVAVALFTAGCGSSSSPLQSAAGGVVNVDPKVLLASITNAILIQKQPVARALGGWEWGGFFSSFGNLLGSINFTNTLDMQKVTYQATGADGQLHAMTGLLILPKAIIGSKPSVPILMFQHGTEPYRQYSPSRFLAHMDRPSDYPEVLVAAAIASTGYAVAMADYEGLGDNTDIQPYVHGDSLAKQVVGMLKASRDIINASSAPCSWNSQLFLMGYSEGGYVTMTTTRELQLNHAGEFTVTASVPLSGPHDLSGEMRTLILSSNTSKAPYFLPFLLTSYNYVTKGALFNPTSAMISTLNTTVPPLFNGNTPSDLINEAMGMSYSPSVNLIVPRNVLVQAFIDQLNDPTTALVDFLKQNDSYRNPANLNTAWVPTVPIRMYHHRSDELVPYGNSQVAFNAFSTAGAKKWVSLVEETASIAIDPVKTVHVGAAFPELSDGWNWIDKNFKK